MQLALVEKLLNWNASSKKGGPNCFDQETCKFSLKKWKAERAKPIGPPVSYQRNNYLKELLTSMSFIVVFVTSIYTILHDDTFYNFKIECFC